MANKEQVERLLSGVKWWNAWREGEGKGVRIDLRGADLRGANLRGANLRGANLSDANLHGADLRGANVQDADLKSATLSGVTLRDATLGGADLRGANLAASSLGNTDLSGVLGLAEVEHTFPSTIGIDTLELTARGLQGDPPERQGEVETFLRGAGVSEAYIDFFRCQIGQPVEFYSAFISYSHADKAFAQRLYNDLQAQGIRCWLDEKDMRLGSPILEVVNQAIRTRDRVILCCSLASLTSRWVEEEIEMAFQRSLEDKWCLIPLDLDGYLFDGWTGSHTGWIRSRLAGNFVGWKQDADLYARELERVVEAMRPRGDRDGE